LKATEIERKFLVHNDSWRVCAGEPHVLQQAYLCRRDQNPIRVRLIDGCSARPTIKFRAPGLARQEYEYEIPVEEARAISCSAREAVSSKKPAIAFSMMARVGMWMSLPAPMRTDTRRDRKAGEDEQPNLPQWLGLEVAGKKRYSNRAMAAALRLSPAAQSRAG
jgi:CYTH domain-containing protein